MDKKSLESYQLENGYCYNSDSMFLYAFARNFLRDNISLLDIGAGSGILGLLCARDFKIKLSLNDINPSCIKLCQKNALANDIKCEFIEGNILDSKVEDFDIIISNPPFYRKDSISSSNPHLFLAKKSENLPFNNLAIFAKNALKTKGKFIFCYDARELKSVISTLEHIGFNILALQFIYPKPQKSAKLAIFCCDFSKSELRILPPIFNFIDSTHSKETLEVFKCCNTLSIKIKEEEL